MSYTVTNLGATFTSGGSISITIGASGAGGAGHIFFVLAMSSAGTTSGSVADSAGNTYSSIGTSLVNGGGGDGIVAFFYCVSPTALTNGQTITYTGSGGATHISVVDITGASALDTAVTKFGNGTTTGSAAISLTSGTPAESGELFIGGAGIATARGEAILPAGWSSPPAWDGSNSGVNGGNMVNAGSTAQSFDVNWSNTTRWAAGIIGFKAAAAAVTWFPMDVEKQPNFAKTDVIGY